MKQYVHGVVENTYENILKIRIHMNNGTYYEWVEDDSEALRPYNEPVAQDVPPNPDDTSVTQCCSTEDLSYRANDSPRSNRSTNLD